MRSTSAIIPLLFAGAYAWPSDKFVRQPEGEISSSAATSSVLPTATLEAESVTSDESLFAASVTGASATGASASASTATGAAQPSGTTSAGGPEPSAGGGSSETYDKGYGDKVETLREDLREKWYRPHTSKDGIDKPADPKSVYTCVGPEAKDYPGIDEWVSWETMWEINEPIIKEHNGGDTHNEKIKKAIEEVSEMSFVDARLILAVIMQESGGKVDVECTGPEKKDCGLMQIKGGVEGKPENIKQMILDGVFGVSQANWAPKGTPGFLTHLNGDKEGLGWLIDVAPKSFWDGNPFAAGHSYNAGRLSDEKLTHDDGAKSVWYPNDMASRLTGWDGGKPGCEKSITDPKCVALGLDARGSC
ncbi:hypothetical protein BU24DRAFT_87114 [Aaosphaeria arxii CBS 175.79]|uniref:Transglycosylase SLT domain-containing protein n=1 Tax=Aaosphaeria arxii CBS 175.79 TaxID=1450172 RepID=A0A6A5X8E0_9PLEO|nr:uncharacterized protein BU24DRAFT_87114 [Aaosphaeria arxii CBS 175.79]KAF2009315.1 hypothetical protein BU24DRAFT_87114 [Aaosphaeria arxii CBS 175.79]